MLRKVVVVLVLLVSVGSSGVQAGEIASFAQYNWLNGAEDISGSRLRHDGVLDPGTVVSHDGYLDSGRVHLNRWAGVDLGYMPELNGAHEVLQRFEDVTEIHTGPEDKAAKYTTAILAGGGDGSNIGDEWQIQMETEHGETCLTFVVQETAETRWRLRTATGESSRYFESLEFRFSAAAAEGEQLAIRWNDGDWVTGGVGTALAGFPSVPPDPWRSVRLNAGSRFDWDPMRADVGTVSFYSDRANVPEPSALVLLMCGTAVCILWHCRRAYRRCQST